jgi:hypothetical protein
VPFALEKVGAVHACGANADAKHVVVLPLS